ncbi:MAG: ketoacyl-ACP synthase III [Brockia lithotrophica]|nr:ketoacyl-ACP synthase III [Brockia lithotrophica]
MAVRAGILGTGAYVPEQVLTNFDLERRMDTSDEWIRSRTGIRERRIAREDQAASDLAHPAAEEALRVAGIGPADLDGILVATTTPDHVFPSTAALLQRKLGAWNAWAFDMSAACSGFIYGLAVAASFVESGRARHVLVVGAEVLSRITDWEDRTTAVLFGDGAGAAVVGPVAEGGFLSFVLGADGGGADLLVLPAGGSRLPASRRTVEERQHFLKMNGREVFKFAVRIMAEASEEALRRAGLTKDDLDLLVPHQANYRIIDAAQERFQLPSGKVVVNLDRYGNMSAASTPVALHEAYRAGRLSPGNVVLLVAFGGGLTWAATVLRWSVPSPLGTGEFETATLARGKAEP